MSLEQDSEINRRIMAREISKEDAIKLLMSLGVPDGIAHRRVRILRGERLEESEPNPDTLPGL
jgi:hypothetical protein